MRRARDKLVDVAGGPVRLKTILLLAAVVSLSGTDVGAVSALAPQLESAFRVGNTAIGLLVTVSTLIGAVATIPVGALADRLSRTRMLATSILLWGLTELSSAFAVTFLMLLLTRLALGMVTATAGPTVASLTGDLFAAKERSRIYGLILTGELLGTGIGVLLAGDIGAAVSWRVGFALLALPSVALSWAMYRHFPEPARGGQSWLAVGAEEIPAAGSLPDETDTQTGDQHQPVDSQRPGHDDPVRTAVRRSAVRPDQALVQDADPNLTIWQAVRWVFRVRTNVSLIVASALGYFFLAGLRTFALIYARGRFGIGQGVATLVFLTIGAAAVAGVLISGRFTDRWIHRGRVDARLLVGGSAFIIAAALFVPALLSGALIIGLPLFVLAAFAMSAPNPPLDAARLDVVPSSMWGRAESIRTTIRTVLEAMAPLIFGLLSAALGGAAAGGFATGVNNAHTRLSQAGTMGLEYTFLIMLVPLAAGGLLLLHGRRTYLKDVATAAASERATSHRSRPEEPVAGRQPLKTAKAAP